MCFSRALTGVVSKGFYAAEEACLGMLKQPFDIPIAVWSALAVCDGEEGGLF